MAKFMVKRSELKNVCKAVNDRKLAELKKEIIEILKKQDEKDFKKATDYLNSQEEHYTHLEKSFSGKWIEKAGYGIGTVRVWKGKKYKKIAPDKWVRVFDKEGRGTNIAIGKLIAKVQKIDNVEDLMAFVMANKQRFVDENGVDLPVLDKLRAAVGVKNENLSGESSSYTYGVGEDVSREKNKIFEGKEKITKEEADLHKVSRKFEQIPTTELKQRKAKLERWIENKTRNKRDSLNNAIFRESYQKELDAINAVLDKRNEKKETSKPAEKDLQRYKTDAQNMTTEQLEYYVEDLKNGTGNIGTENIEERKKIYTDELNKRMKSGKSAEKEDYKIAQSGKLATQKQVDYATEVSDKYSLTREEMLKKPITAIQKYANSTVEDFDGGIDKFIEYMADGRSEGVSLDEVGKEFGKLINHNIARKIWKDYESGALEVNDNGIFEPKKETKEKTAKKKYANKDEAYKDLIQLGKDKSELLDNIKKRVADLAMTKEKKYNAEARGESTEELDSEIKKIQNDINDMEDRRAEIEFAGSKLVKEIDNLPEKEMVETKTYWIQDSRGNRLTNEDAKKRIQSNLSKIIELESGDEPRKDMKIRDLKLDNEYLKERLNPDDRKEFVSKVRKSLFDGFLGLELLEEDVDDIEKDKEEESLWNDYSAEEPDDFNSTELQVREAMNRHFDNCL